MNASSRWQEIIAENLAASQIPGFKKQDFSFNAVQAGYLTSATGAAKRASMPLAATATNFQAGEIRSTGVSTDVAIEGPGFFKIRTPDGATGYTRDGEFHINAQGQLLTKQGLAVMGQTDPIQIDPGNPAPVVIAATGEISQGGEQKGQLKLTEFNNPAALTTAGVGLYFDSDLSAQPVAANKSTVRQGYLENANTSTVMEMGNLISAMRFYEANQKVVQSEDDRIGRLISDVATPS
jgi:flagellar basal-body rod protein FlgF